MGVVRSLRSSLKSSMEMKALRSKSLSMTETPMSTPRRQRFDGASHALEKGYPRLLEGFSLKTLMSMRGMPRAAQHCFGRQSAGLTVCRSDFSSRKID